MLSCELAKEEVEMFFPLTQVQARQLCASEAQHTCSRDAATQMGAADVSINYNERSSQIQLLGPTSHTSRAEGPREADGSHTPTWNISIIPRSSTGQE